MNETTPTPDPILTTLRDREAELLTELAAANQAVAMVNARIDEVRDLISKMTDGRRRPRKKAVPEPTLPIEGNGADERTNEGLAL